MTTKGEGFFQEVDVLTVIKTVGKKSKVSQAKILQKLETVVPPEEFSAVRTLVLDEINDLTRTFVRSTFGDIEYLIK
jgi:hypothetical protein